MLQLCSRASVWLGQAHFKVHARYRTRSRTCAGSRTLKPNPLVGLENRGAALRRLGMASVHLGRHERCNGSSVKVTVVLPGRHGIPDEPVHTRHSRGNNDVRLGHARWRNEARKHDHTLPAPVHRAP
jgi:hypothetical protein